MANTHNDEQIETLRKWWSDNGTSVVLVAVLAVGAVFGWRWWQERVETQGIQASSLYQELLEAIAAPPMEDVGEEQVIAARYLADDLKTRHTDSAYARFAALHMARLAVLADDLEQAEAELRWVLEHGGDDDEVGELARIRLSRLLGVQERAADGLALLDAGIDFFPSAAAEARGDLLIALGREEEARDAYEQALGQLPEGTGKPLLDMKLADISPRQTSTGATVSDDAVLPPTAEPGADTSADAGTNGGDADDGADDDNVGDSTDTSAEGGDD